MGLYRVRQQHRHTSSRAEACHRGSAAEGCVREACTQAWPVSMQKSDVFWLANSTHSHVFLVKTLFLPCPIFLSPVHHTFLENTQQHLTHTYSPFFLRCVCTRLPGRKSFSGMDECLQPIHHPPYPPPSPLFLYQPAVTLTTDGPLSRLLCSFPFFSPPQVFLAISLFSRSPVPYLLCLYTWQRACLWAFVHAFSPPHLHLLLSPSSIDLPALTPPPLPSPLVIPSLSSSPSIYLSPVHHWDRSGTFRVGCKKAL